MYRQLLLKIASLVKPIMVKHGWKVGTLAEVSNVVKRSGKERLTATRCFPIIRVF